MTREYTRVYHFTKAVHAIDDLQKRRVKISVFDRVNDPQELRAYVLVGLPAPPGENPDSTNEFIVMSFVDQNCFLCLAPNSSSSVMWDRYGDADQGICLGLDVKTSLLRKVKYVDEVEVGYISPDFMGSVIRQRAKMSGKKSPPALKRAARLFEPYITTKFRTGRDELGTIRDWSDEQELRAFLTKDEKEGGLYFAEFSNRVLLKEVIVGASCDVSEDLIRELTNGYPHPPIKITSMKTSAQSELPAK